MKVILFTILYTLFTWYTIDIVYEFIGLRGYHAFIVALGMFAIATLAYVCAVLNEFSE